MDEIRQRKHLESGNGNEDAELEELAELMQLKDDLKRQLCTLREEDEEKRAQLMKSIEEKHLLEMQSQKESFESNQRQREDLLTASYTEKMARMQNVHLREVDAAEARSKKEMEHAFENEKNTLTKEFQLKMKEELRAGEEKRQAIIDRLTQKHQQVCSEMKKQSAEELENLQKHMENRLTALEASKKGALRTLKADLQHQYDTAL